MKKPVFLILFFTGVFCSDCTTTKNVAGHDLFNVTWELEYLSGPRIAFQGLFPDKKPYIRFNPEEKKVEGNNGCNGYSAEYTLGSKQEISFGEPGPTTMMYCGEGEQFFLNTINKVNNFNVDKEGKLNLKMDEVVMMRFRRN